MTEKRQHSLERTSPKGQEFIGKCVWCGMENLPSRAVWDDCPDQTPQRTRVIKAIEGNANAK